MGSLSGWLNTTHSEVVECVNDCHSTMSDGICLWTNRWGTHDKIKK